MKRQVISLLGIKSAFVLTLALTPISHAGVLTSEMMVNGNVGQEAVAQQPNFLQFSFVDNETGMYPHHFHEMHLKPMHLIIVSEDLSHFVHVHPTNRPHRKISFDVTLNEETNDPDNFDLPRALPFGGRFFVFGEVMPMDYGMLVFPYDLKAQGSDHVPEKLIVDPISEDHTINKFFIGDEPTLNESDAQFKVKLKIEPIDHCGIILPKLNLEFYYKKSDKDSKKSEGVWAPVEDFETWLDSMGHAIMVSEVGEKASDKITQHLHAVWPLPTGNPDEDEHGPYIELAAHSHKGSMPKGTYKTWVQVKRQGHVFTLPFVFEWDPAWSQIHLGQFKKPKYFVGIEHCSKPVD